MNKKIALLALRYFVSLFFISQSLFEFNLQYYVNPTDKMHWITSFSGVNLFMSIGFFALGIVVLVGKSMRIASLLSMGFIVLNHFFLLLEDPFYNYTELTLVLLISCITLLLTTSSVETGTEQDSVALNTNESKKLTYLSLRLFLGIIMLVQGSKVLFFRSKPLITYIYGNYIEPYEKSFLPKFSLWTMGYLNPFLLFIPGIMLLIGLKTRVALYLACFFFMSLIFGHLVDTPYFGENMSASGILCLMSVFILYFEDELNAYSIDKLWQKRQG